MMWFIRIAAIAAASYSAVATAALTFIPNLYPDPEMTSRVQYYVFLVAILGFVLMLVCYFDARRNNSARR